MKNTTTIKITLDGVASRPKEKITPKQNIVPKKNKILSIVSDEKIKNFFKVSIFKK